MVVEHVVDIYTTRHLNFVLCPRNDMHAHIINIICPIFTPVSSGGCAGFFWPTVCDPSVPNSSYSSHVSKKHLQFMTYKMGTFHLVKQKPWLWTLFNLTGTESWLESLETAVLPELFFAQMTAGMKVCYFRTKLTQTAETIFSPFFPLFGQFKLKKQQLYC